ncbi:MAG: HNH endonuclease signature motif containing protein [Candidatus Binatia bacterium]|nr:HNH endonuclease signature motif containing protein [Candidatus Binatia bacterium]
MSDIPARLRRLVVLRVGNRCEYCRLAQKGQEATFHVDHILPKAAGGRTTAANLALACVSCSLRKETFCNRTEYQPKSCPVSSAPPAVARPLSLGRSSSCRANADG